MEDSFGGMFKLTGSNYSVWKSKMRDKCQFLWKKIEVMFENKNVVNRVSVFRKDSETPV